MKIYISLSQSLNHKLSHSFSMSFILSSTYLHTYDVSPEPIWKHSSLIFYSCDVDRALQTSRRRRLGRLKGRRFWRLEEVVGEIATRKMVKRWRRSHAFTSFLKKELMIHFNEELPLRWHTLWLYAKSQLKSPQVYSGSFMVIFYFIPVVYFNIICTLSW